MCFLALLTACSTSRPARRYAASPALEKTHVGLCVRDAVTGKELLDWQADRYFTPASNVKILTLAACLEILGDTLTRLRYDFAEGDTSEPLGMFFLQGSGDPTWLHPDFQAWQPAPAFLNDHPHAMQLLIGTPGFSENDRFGAGWSWDDFPAYYSPERSALPVYGNSLHVQLLDTGWMALPRRFQDSLRYDPEAKTVTRTPFSGRISVPKYPGQTPGETFVVPLFRPAGKAVDWLNDSLHIHLGSLPEITTVLHRPWKVCPADTVCRRMMHQSDNFIAEQLLLMCGGERYGLLQQAPAIRWLRDTLWQDLANPPRWVDGSGLSRYNLVTPRYFTGVLHRLWRSQPRERLLDLFPAAGVDGTVADWRTAPDGQPYVYAKSGSMGGVYCLSGYLQTKKGRMLVFSVLHNGFIGSNRPVKNEVQRLLENLYRRY